MGDTVFVLGAGFSRAVSPEMPTLGKLSVDVRSYLQDEPRLTEIASRFGDDIEAWLSYLAGDSPWLDGAEVLANQALLGRVSEAIAEVLKVSQLKALMDPMPPWLEQLVVFWRRSGSTVLTFNYDLFVELASSLVSDEKHESWSSVYAVPVVPAGARVAALWSSSAERPFTLLKMHGSMTWWWPTAGQRSNAPVYDSGLTPEGGWSPEGAASRYEDRLDVLLGDQQPMIIPPTATKSTYYSHGLIRRQWAIAAAAIRRARRVVFMGYSLPASDLTVRSMLLTNLPDQVEIVPVDTSDGPCARLATLVGEGRVACAFSGIADPIPAFVAQNCSPPLD